MMVLILTLQIYYQRIREAIQETILFESFKAKLMPKKWVNQNLKNQKEKSIN